MIIGGSGFIGTHLALRLRETYKVFATAHQNMMRLPGVTFIPANLNKRDWLKRVVYLIRPNVVIFAAGSSDVEQAEKDHRAFEDIHTSGAGNAAQVADMFQPRFIYLSSCYTFDGNRGNYRETDTVLPGTALGKAKLGGENLVRTRSLNHILLRSSPVLGVGNGLHFSFLDQLRMKLDRGQRIELPDDEIHSFVTIDSLVEVVERLAESGLRNKIVHYGGLTKLSTLDMGRRFARRFGFDPGLIIPRKVSYKPVGLNAPEFLDFSLNSTFAAENLKVQPLLLEEGFDLIEKNLIARS